MQRYEKYDSLISFWKKNKILLILILISIFIFLFSWKYESLAKAFAASGTVSAVLWALYHQEIKCHRERPLLQIKTFELDIPYFRKADEIDYRTETISGYGYYINIPIENIGKRTAKNCQPIITAIAKYKNNIWEKEINWIPVPLSWAADEREYSEGEIIDGKVTKKFPKVERDLIPYRPYFFNLGRFRSHQPNSLEIMTATILTAQNQVFEFGHYSFEIKIVAEETKPEIRYFEIEWNVPCTLEFKEFRQKIKFEIKSRPPW